MNYFDSSALLKLLFEERESPDLAAWVAEQSATSAVSSELVHVEVLRATRRIDARVVPTARRLLTQLDLVPLSSDLVALAAEVGGDLLRSLDAIHLASAISLGSALTTLVAYDARLVDAATEAGISTIQPGAR